MNFLNSAFLAGLAAAVVPLLIHLLNRRRVRKVDFSSIMFLRDLRKSRMRRLELRRWLLLTIRTLMIAFAVLAFARPALRGDSLAGLGSRARTTAVIGVDLSASMALETANGTAQERGRRRLRDIGTLFGDGDELIALPFSGETRPVPETPTAAIAPLFDRLAGMETRYSATDATGALNSAATVLAAAHNLNREFYLITDDRRENFTRSTIDSVAGTVKGMKVYLVDVSEKQDVFDLGVTGVSLTDRLLEPKSPFNVTATIKNNADRPIDKVLASLFIDGRRVAQIESSLGPLGTATVNLPGSVDEPGSHTGFVEITPDDNPRDNRRYFALTIPDQIRVLLASDSPSGRRATALAMAPEVGGNNRVRIDEIDSPDLVRQNLFDYDAVLITDWQKPDRLAMEQIIRYVRAGGGVLIAPSFDADTTAWNTLIATPQFGLRLGPPPLEPSPDRFFVWEKIDWNHPIWSVYRDVPAEKIPEIQWFSIFRTEGTLTGASLVDFSGGRPALSESRLDAGKLIVSWSPINTPYTDLPLRSLFVPFVNRTVEYLAADLSERRGDFAVGERAVREPARGLGPDATVEVVRPDGSLARPGLETSGSRTRVTYDGTDEPGVYQITAGGKAVDAFSVNVDPTEMDPTPIDRDEVSRLWPGVNVINVGAGESVKDIVEKTRYGTEIGPFFLWAVVVLFFLEMLVARTRRRDLVATDDGSDAVPVAEGAHFHPAE
jgi:hypothetical protein